MDFNPFIKNSPDILAFTHGYNEAIYRLNHLLATKGFGVITAGAGRGKTTTIRHWVKSFVDEVNYIHSGILNDMKMLFNFEMNSKDRAILILTGLPILNNTLQKTTHEPLRQRITMNYHLDDLSEADCRLYIEKRLQAAKCNQIVFEDSAILAILNAANGTPRLINRICDKCLLVGHAQQVNIINSDIVIQAIDEAELR